MSLKGGGPLNADDLGGYDVVILGSGIAGLTAALTAAGRGRVALITQGALGEGCTSWAQGGIAVATGPDDSPDLHFADTIAAGRGLCDEAAVRVLVDEAPDRVATLVGWGVALDGDGTIPTPAREAAHSRARVLHAGGDATGRAIESALIRRLRCVPVDVFDHTEAVGLLVAGERCVGVNVHDRRRRSSRLIGAGAVILATGGAGALWRATTNPPSASGAGIALAFEVGADVASMEFMQFHPTVLAVPGAPRFLISEAVRGAGAWIVDRRGHRFVFESHADGELAPRDVVALAIWREAEQSDGGVFLDCRPSSEPIATRFPTIHRTCLAHGVDPARDPIPIAPAAHYLIGGVRTGLDGRTTVDGLYACGEVASTGVHGANRLASNSLLEGLVFAHRAANAALQSRAEAPPPTVRYDGFESVVGSNGRHEGEAAGRLRDAMWQGAGVVRDQDGLRRSLATVDEVLEHSSVVGPAPDPRVHRSASIARLVVNAALAREESRGAHQRDDFRTSNDKWHGIQVMRHQEGLSLVNRT